MARPRARVRAERPGERRRDAAGPARPKPSAPGCQGGLRSVRPSRQPSQALGQPPLVRGSPGGAEAAIYCGSLGPSAGAGTGAGKGADRGSRKATRPPPRGCTPPGVAGADPLPDALLRLIAARILAPVGGAIRRVPTRSQSRPSRWTLGLAAVPVPLRDTGGREPEHPAVGHPSAIPPALPLWPAGPPLPWLPYASVPGLPPLNGVHQGRVGPAPQGWPAPCCCSP